MPDHPTHKPCSKCGETKPLEAFSRAKLGRYGRRGECKKCAMTAQRALRGNVELDREAQPHPSTGKRRCAVCRTIKPLDEFSPPLTRTRRGRTWLEWDSRCRECNAMRQRARVGGDVTAPYQRFVPADPATIEARRARARQYQWEDYRRHRAERQAYGRKQAQRWREANRERHRQQTRDWRRKNLDRQQAQSAVKRARLLDAYVEHVNRLVVLELYDGACGICGQDVDPLDFEVDHIIPLSRGGLHNYENTEPAHPFCNGSKHAAMPG